MIERVLRALALLIVVAAIIDPAVTSTRTSKPDIAVVAADSMVDGALAAQVARDLSSSFTVVTAPFASASGTVVVGSQLPAHAAELARPVFVVTPDSASPTVAIEDIEAPVTVPLATRVPVVVKARVTRAQGQRLKVILQLGELVVDEVVLHIGRSDERLRIPLSFVPVATGVTALRVTASASGATNAWSADVAMDVHDTRWPVLFYDTRPSWMSTFVRRAIERDARFVVTSRIVTSRGASREAGAAPASLDDPTVRTLFNVIVVGAPELLTDRDMTALDLFMRRRGGSVVLLFDQRATARSERLTAVSTWSGATIAKPVRLSAVGADSVSVSATDWMWPATLPPGAEPLLVNVQEQGDGAGRAAVWQVPVGAGRLVSSGALDSWKYRDPSQSGFETFWVHLLADAADGSATPLVGHLSATTVAPGEEMSLTMVVRDVALAPRTMGTPVTTSIGAAITSSDVAEGAAPVVRLWPYESAGQMRADFRAPRVPGPYRVRLSANDNVETLSFVVREGAARTAPPDRDLLVHWASATGGQQMSSALGSRLNAVMSRSVTALPRRVSWHPMRSLWWLPLFCVPLCAEWWLRRRRGLP